MWTVVHRRILFTDDDTRDIQMKEEMFEAVYTVIQYKDVRGMIVPTVDTDYLVSHC